MTSKDRTTEARRFEVADLHAENLDECYRELGENISALGARRQLKYLAVTSTAHGEGVSTVACGLAASLAHEKQRDVLLVDANFRRSSLARLFGVESEFGLTDAILGDTDSGELIAASGVPNLFVLGSGRLRRNSERLLVSDGFKHLLEDTAHRFSIVIFDTPPVAPYQDTPALSALVDGVLLVIQAERLRYEVIARARDKVSAAGGNVLGAALNRRRYHIPEAVYRRL